MSRGECVFLLFSFCYFLTHPTHEIHTCTYDTLLKYVTDGPLKPGSTAAFNDHSWFCHFTGLPVLACLSLSLWAGSASYSRVSYCCSFCPALFISIIIITLIVEIHVASNPSYVQGISLSRVASIKSLKMTKRACDKTSEV